MSGLTHRISRPLLRDGRSLRDDRLFIIACDDTYAPKQYFDFFRMPRIQIHVFPALDRKSAAKHVLTQLLEIQCDDDDERWLLLDTDHCLKGTHFRGFIAALNEARQQGIRIALSKPCFELWLLLHHVDETQVETLQNATETGAALQDKLGGYDKTKLNKDKFSLESVAQAYSRAKRLDATVSGGDKPDKNTSRVYLLWESIISKALPSQIPKELVALREDR